MNYLIRLNGGERNLIWNPETGLFGGLDHAAAQLPEEMDAFVREWRRNNLEARDRKLSMRLFTGGACNMGCAYCIQEGMKGHADTAKPDAGKVCDALAWLFRKSGREKFELNFMGGEPLLHWPLLTQVMERLESMIPGAEFSIITNGTLFDGEKARFCIGHDVFVSLSHDGPGQALRGKDPLAPRSASHAALLWFFRERPRRFSVNPVLTTGNFDLGEIWGYLENRMHGKLHVSEALPCTPVTEEHAKSFCLTSPEEIESLKNRTCTLLLTRHADYFHAYADMLCALAFNTAMHEPARRNGRCSAYGEHPFVMDLGGNLRRCTSCGNDGMLGGVSNACGNIFTLMERDASLEETVRDMSMKPAAWMEREECHRCPWIAMCQGGCPLGTETLRTVNCGQRGAVMEGVFIAMLASMYPGLEGYEILPMEAR